MRNTLLIIILLILFSNAYAQVNKFLLDETRNWEVFQAEGGAPCTFISGGGYFLKGDSLVNGILYKKVYSNPVKSELINPFCPPYYLDTTEVHFFTLIREDLLDGKVYIWQDQQDQLYFDYSLKGGDILNTPFSSQGGDLLIDSVGSIVLMTGEQIKVWYFDNGEYFLEGIGGSQGLGFPFLEGIGFWNEVTCVTENGKALFGVECLGTSGSKEVPERDFLLYPNPNDGRFTLKTSNRIHSISIYNSVGQLVQSYFKNGEVMIAEEAKPGVYIVLVDMAGFRFLKRMVVLK